TMLMGWTVVAWPGELASESSAAEASAQAAARIFFRLIGRHPPDTKKKRARHDASGHTKARRIRALVAARTPRVGGARRRKPARLCYLPRIARGLRANPCLPCLRPPSIRVWS